MGNQTSREPKAARRGKRRKLSRDDMSSGRCSDESVAEVCVCESSRKRLRRSTDSHKCTASTQTDRKLAPEKRLVPRDQPCGMCKELFNMGLLSDIPVRQGERLTICPACLIQNQTALSIVQSSFRDVVPSRSAILERVSPQRQPQGDFGSHGPIKSREASRTLTFDVPQPDSEGKHALMEDLRCSNEKRTQKITSVLHKLDERLTNIQNMTSRATSGESCLLDGSSAKLLAELRSLEVKTRSLDAKLIAADRKQDEMESKILGATENLRNFLDQLVVLENRSKLLDDNVHNIVRRLGGYEESSRALGERVNSVRSDMEYLQESTKKSDDKIDHLSTAVQFQLKKMKDMEGNFMDMDERLDKVSEQVGTVEGKLNSRAVKVADVTAKLTEFDNKFRTTDHAIRKIESIQESVKDLPDVQVKLRQLSDKVEYETSGLPSAESLMREVDRAVEPLRRKLESVDQKLAEVQREQVEVAKHRRVSELPSALKSPQSKKVTFVEPAPVDRPTIVPRTSLEHDKDEKDLNKFEESDSSGASEVFESRQRPAVNQTKLPTRPRSAPAGRPVPLLATKAFSLRAAGKPESIGGSDDALSSRNPLKSSLKTSMDSLLPLNNKELATATRFSNPARNSSVASPARQTSFTPWDDGDEDREPAQRSGGFMENPAIRTMIQKSGHSVRTSKEIEVDDHGSGDS